MNNHTHTATHPHAEPERCVFKHGDSMYHAHGYGSHPSLQYWRDRGSIRARAV